MGRCRVTAARFDGSRQPAFDRRVTPQLANVVRTALKRIA
jgi:hypothetical protein